MNTKVGYVLVSHVYSTSLIRCSACASSGSRTDFCPQPRRPLCHAACVRDPKLLAEHPECQEWQRAEEAWVAAHVTEERTGGTRLGPLHYFADCPTLGKRGHRRADARIIAINSDMAQALDLDVCKHCQAQMAPFETQMQIVDGVHAGERSK